MLASLVAVNNPFPFSISGFTGLTTAQIISFFIVFVLFNAYVVLIVIALVGFYFTVEAPPRRGSARPPSGTSTRSSGCSRRSSGTVWGAPAEKTFLGGTGLATLGIGQRAINEFISMGFAVIAVLCMAPASPGRPRRTASLREEVLAAV